MVCIYRTKHVNSDNITTSDEENKISRSTHIISVIDDVMHCQQSLEYDHPACGLSPLQQMSH